MVVRRKNSNSRNSRNRSPSPKGRSGGDRGRGRQSRSQEPKKQDLHQEDGAYARKVCQSRKLSSTNFLYRIINMYFFLDSGPQQKSARPREVQPQPAL